MSNGRMVAVVLTLGLLMAVQAEARAEFDFNADSFDRSTIGQALVSPDTIVDPPVPWPMYFGVQQTGEIITRFDCYGGFGEGFSQYPNWSGWPGGSFVAPPDTGAEYLFAGGIWVGGIVGGDTLVSTAMDGWIGIREMYPDGNQPAVTKVPSPADFTMRAEFSDTSVWLGGYDSEDGGRVHMPLDLHMVNRSHVWRTDPENQTVIYDLLLTNVGSQVIEDAYVGFYFDCDVCYDCASGAGYTDDITGTLRDHGIAYIIDNDGDLTPLNPGELPAPRAFGFKFLASTFDPVDTNFNWWISHGTSSLDFGPRLKETPGDPWRDFGTGGLGTPARDDNKYYILSHTEWDYDQIMTPSIEPDDPIWLGAEPWLAMDFANGYDTRFLVSIGPFDLVPGESQRLLYATFTSSDVHTYPDNIDNLIQGTYDPEAYLDSLHLTSLITNGELSDSLAGILLDPALPPTGLRVAEEDENEITVEWDKWCSDNVAGYHVYLSEIPVDSLPYPGVPAPWLRPTELSEVAYVGSGQTSYILDNLEPHKFYYVNIAHETAKGVGEACDPIYVKLPDPPFVPLFEMEFSFYEAGGPVTLNWSPPEATTVDHYNVYRFDSSQATTRKYYPFYDEGYSAAWIDPQDSFFVDGTTYYYYAMEPYATVTPSKTVFTDYDVQEDRVYVVTAVDEYGFESLFSIDVTATEVLPRTQDILVITHARKTGILWMNFDSVLAFYDSVLIGYDYDIYDWHDSAKIYLGMPDWHDFSRYDLVLIDQGAYEDVVGNYIETYGHGFSKYLLSGGKLGYFGLFGDLLGQSAIDDPGYRDASHPFIQRFFGIDSSFYVGWAYFHHNSLPMEDTLFAFRRAQPALAGFPAVTYDTSANRFSHISNLWPTDDSPPCVSVFGVNETGVTTHLFESIPGVSSMNAGQPGGVHTVKEHSNTYLFGFHLWYMEHDGARALIEAMLLEPPKVVAEPDTLWAYYAHAIDTMTLSLYLGDFNDGHDVVSIDMSSVRLDGDMEPMRWELLGGYPGFDGEVARFDFSVTEFIERQGEFFGTSQYSFPLTGSFGDEGDFSVTVPLTLAGKLPGDLNGDGQVNMADLVCLVALIFQGGPEPEWELACDLDGDGACGVTDITYMVSYLYLGGPAPVG